MPVYICSPHMSKGFPFLSVVVTELGFKVGEPGLGTVAGHSF